MKVNNINKTRFIKDLGQWIAHLRRSKRLGQDQLTEEAGLSRGTLSKIEQGLVDAQATTLAKLAHAMEIPLWKIFDMSQK